MRWILAALALAGCAASGNSPHYFKDFRTARIEMTGRQILNGPNRNTPQPVIAAYAECTTDYLLHYTSPEDKAALDAWAQQKRTLSQADHNAMEQRARAAGAVTIDYNSFDALTGTCPESVPLFKQYFH